MRILTQEPFDKKQKIVRKLLPSSINQPKNSFWIFT